MLCSDTFSELSSDWMLKGVEEEKTAILNWSVASNVRGQLSILVCLESESSQFLARALIWNSYKLQNWKFVKADCNLKHWINYCHGFLDIEANAKGQMAKRKQQHKKTSLHVQVMQKLYIDKLVGFSEHNNFVAISKSSCYYFHYFSK